VTGEDTAEFSCHGNPLVVQRVIEAAVAAGARVAERGDFTRRALENGKLDLLRAEAVLQVTHATSMRGVRIGRAALDGRLGEVMDGLRQTLVVAAAELEARLDYPGDELAMVDDDALVASLREVVHQAERLSATWDAGRHFVHGARVALVGPVNAGKSSMFNALVGRRRALVHDTPGTTRDVLEVVTSLQDLSVTLLDTAGERETEDPIEAAGLALARDLVEEADLLVVMLRADSNGISETEQRILDRTKDRPRVVVYNGVDRLGAFDPPAGAIPTSVSTGLGLDALRIAMRRQLVGEPHASTQLMLASSRQRDRLNAMAACVAESIEALPLAGVAVAADGITRGIEELDALTGNETREDILDALFARFCIGK
jgi:tRNA modification GTPase